MLVLVNAVLTQSMSLSMWSRKRRSRLLSAACRLALALLTLAPVLQIAQAFPPVTSDYIVILDEAPVVTRYPGRIERTRAASVAYRQHLQQTQATVRTQIEAQRILVLGGVQHLMNALFVRATPQQVEALKSISGVKAVIPSRRYHLTDQLTLSDVQGAWTALKIGGQSNAGAGLKIGIIDTGIDQTHPSFQDSSLSAPSGFPKCDVPSNCAFTSNKVIVARSYVSYLTAGSSASDPAADSRPDDLDARDLIGHGTAVSSVAAGVPGTADGASISGVAPKAFLGNYKIFGSPEVNPYASGAGIIAALDDAVTDGMDVVNLSLGSPAFESPLDTGATCGLPVGQPCDPQAYAVEQAVASGQVLVVVAAGNEGSTGYQYTQNGTPTFGTIASPAYTPSALAAGGVRNDVAYAATVDVSGTGVPSDLAEIPAYPSAAGPPSTKITGPLADVTKLGDSDGLLCTGIAAGSMTGDLALILRGTCTFSVKVANAQAAGAIGVIFINNVSNPAIVTVSGLTPTQIPAYMISQADGEGLKSYADSNSSAQVTLNPSTVQTSAASIGFIPKAVAYFASRGPATGNYGLKPDAAAVATDFLLAAESYDPYGDVYSATGYTHADGTSFSTPMLAGAAALVLQANPGLTPLQMKSALVNTATLSGLTTQDGSAPASVSEVGSGILQAQNAVLATVQIVPSSVSFGLLSGALPGAQSLTVTNSGSSAVSLAVSVSQISVAGGPQVMVNGASSTTLNVAAGGSATLQVSLPGSVPAPGRYEGLITFRGGPVTLEVPYMFLVASKTAYDLIPLYGQSFDGPISQVLPPGEGPLLIRVIDQYGAAVQGIRVNWAATQGGGSIESGIANTSDFTDENGIAYATAALGPTVGSQAFTATVSGMVLPYTGNARIQPTISSGGIVDAASFTNGRAVAPGSLISVFGNGLADENASAIKVPLPYGIDGTAFSFDVPSAGISVPGRFFYISPGQLNVQVPWELAGQASVTVKAIVNFTYSAEYTLPLAAYSPGFFANSVGGQLIAAALDLNYHVISAINPATRGSTVQLYLNGLGPVQTTPADGAAVSSADSTTTTASITIGGQPAMVSYSGLAPNFVGLYQVNAVVPASIGTGLQPITCSIGGVSCPTVMLPVQ